MAKSERLATEAGGNDHAEEPRTIDIVEGPSESGAVGTVSETEDVLVTLLEDEKVDIEWEASAANVPSPRRWWREGPTNWLISVLVTEVLTALIVGVLFFAVTDWASDRRFQEEEEFEERRNLQFERLENLRLVRTALAQDDFRLFTGVDLTGMNLATLGLSGANFNSANLTEANFTEADLTESKFVGANLTQVDLTGAELAGADFSGACVVESQTQGYQPIWPDKFDAPVLQQCGD